MENGRAVLPDCHPPPPPHAREITLNTFTLFSGIYLPISKSKSLKQYAAGRLPAWGDIDLFCPPGGQMEQGWPELLSYCF